MCYVVLCSGVVHTPNYFTPYPSNIICTVTLSSIHELIYPDFVRGLCNCQVACEGLPPGGPGRSLLWHLALCQVAGYASCMAGSFLGGFPCLAGLGAGVAGYSGQVVPAGLLHHGEEGMEILLACLVLLRLRTRLRCCMSWRKEGGHRRCAFSYADMCGIVCVTCIND